MYNEDIRRKSIFASRNICFPPSFIPPARHVLFHLRPVQTETIEIQDKALQTTEFLNPELPGAQIKDDGIGSKYENMAKSWGKIQDYSAVDNIDREEPDKTRKSMNRNTRRTTSTCSRKNNRKKLRQRKLPLPRHENRKHLPNWKKHSQRRD